MKKHIVTEDVEIILDGKKCLLEVGDTIQVISEQMWMQSQQILAIDAPGAVEAVTEMGDMEHMGTWIWITVDGEARTLDASSYEHAAYKIKQYRISLGEAPEEAQAHMEKNDQIFEVLGHME